MNPVKDNYYYFSISLLLSESSFDSSLELIKDLFEKNVPKKELMDRLLDVTIHPKWKNPAIRDQTLMELAQESLIKQHLDIAKTCIDSIDSHLLKNWIYKKYLIELSKVNINDAFSLVAKEKNVFLATDFADAHIKDAISKGDFYTPLRLIFLLRERELISLHYVHRFLFQILDPLIPISYKTRYKEGTQSDLDLASKIFKEIPKSYKFFELIHKIVHVIKLEINSSHRKRIKKYREEDTPVYQDFFAFWKEPTPPFRIYEISSWCFDNFESYFSGFQSPCTIS